MRKTLLTLLIVSLFQLGFGQSDTVLLNTDVGSLSGTLLLPEKLESKCPVALIIAGSGPTDRDGNNPLINGKNNSLKMLAEGLVEGGVASLRYDKRGLGLSQGAAIAEADLRFDHFVDDAKAWITLLKNDDRFSEVIVMGHSEGSLIGMIAAKEAQADRYVSLAGAGQPADKILREQFSMQSEFIKNEATAVLDSLVIGKTKPDVNPLLFSIFRPAIQPYLISWMQKDPQKIIKSLSIPVLIVQGTTDIQVGEGEAKLLKAANPSAELLLIEGMSHILKAGPKDRMANYATYGDPSLALKSELLPGILHFIKK
ncbi:MAG: alpha/beta hydrolase [Flammeovirgaceae bacterium]